MAAERVITAATLIGDLVASKRAPDRAAVQRRLRSALKRVNALVRPLQPLEVTIGDEFQGAYPSVGLAVRAALLVRLALLPVADSRYGLGWGELTVFDAKRRPVSQDGPAWWAAREAIEQVQASAGRRGHARSLRTWFVDQGAPPLGAAGGLNAFLLCRDEALGQQSERAQRLLLGWMTGRSQAELAAEEKISQSAVSQQLGRSGAYAMRDAQEALEGSPAWIS